MMRYPLALVLWLMFFCAQAQTGNYFLSHYSPQQENIDHFSFDMAQDDNGIIYYANKAGVLQFDGRNWHLTTTPGPVYTLAVANNQVFAAGLTGFGRLVKSQNELLYENLSGVDPKATNIFQSLATKDRVYFLTHELLFVVEAATGQIVQKIAPSSGLFNGIFELQGDIYLDRDGEELLLLKGETLGKSQVNPAAGEIVFSHTLAGKNISLIGTSGDRVFIYQNKTLTEIKLKDAEYVQRNVLLTGAWVTETLVALGTLRGGVVFIDPQTGDTKEIINYYTGLPDNEVYALMADRNNGIWVAHEYGFTRIAPFLPFRSFSHYPGLEGNLLCAHSINNQIYVGTTLGLYKLEPDEVYAEETYYVTKSVQGKNQPAREPVIEATEAQEKARRGLFGRRKREKEAEKESATTTAAAAAAPAAKPLTVKEKRTRKILVGLQYRYRKVNDITGKVTHLMEIDGSLYAAGLDGVFKVDGLNTTVVTNEPVRSIFLSPSLQQLIISTYNETIRSFAKAGDRWQPTQLLDTLNEYVSYMFEDKLQNLWLCGRAATWKVEMVDGKIVNIDKIAYLQPSIDETVGLAVGSDVYVVNAGEFQRYDAAHSQFVKYDSLPGTRKYFASAGSFWFHDGHRWRTIDRRLSQSMQLEWLGLFSDIRYLTSADQQQSLWVISASNELYRFAPDVNILHKDYPLFLREIRGPAPRFVKSGFQLEEEQGALTFEFIQPDYVGLQSIEYRYLVAGLNDSWSEWSPANNVITFPYLPSGEYEISVQSKNLFGKVNELDKIYFSVLPPYWKRPWFYAMEVAFFSMLVLLSVKLSVSNPRYKPISRVLSLLTVIMFIQLVQTSVYSLINIQSSPVVEFGVQVMIAMLVLPLEFRLRNFMEKAAEGRYDLSKVLKARREAEMKE